MAETNDSRVGRRPSAPASGASVGPRIAGAARRRRARPIAVGRIRQAVAALVFASLLVAGAAGCAARRLPSEASGPWEGNASWYGADYHGRRAADGSRYNMYELTAAHRTLPFGTRLLVTNLRNGRSVKVTITDRGPFIDGRIIDLSFAAAQAVGMVADGVAPVRLEMIE